MHSFTTILALLATAFTLVRSCSTVESEITFYGEPDNSPAGCDIAYDCGRGYTAGGDGSYADPLTFASSPDEFTPCQVVYLPYLKKYLRMEDQCEQCIDDWPSKYHIDIWTSPNNECVNGGTDQINCEDDLTPSAEQEVVIDPPEGLTVVTTALYNSGTCATGNTFSGATYSC